MPQSPESATVFTYQAACSVSSRRLRWWVNGVSWGWSSTFGCQEPPRGTAHAQVEGVVQRRAHCISPAMLILFLRKKSVGLGLTQNLQKSLPPRVPLNTDSPRPEGKPDCQPPQLSLPQKNNKRKTASA